MGAHRIDVEVLTLEDFRRTLDHRMAEAQALLRRAEDVAGGAAPLGAFLDAESTRVAHQDRAQQKVQRIRQLISAISATQVATDRIITRYRTAEARNKAKAEDVTKILGEGPSSVWDQIVRIARDAVATAAGGSHV